MDMNNAGTQAGITSAIVFAGGILYKIFMTINNKRCRSRCCGYDMEMDFKVDDIPPSPPISVPEIVIHNPLKKEEPVVKTANDL